MLPVILVTELMEILVCHKCSLYDLLMALLLPFVELADQDIDDSEA